MKIDVWSDIACPWCYIGKRRLEYDCDSVRHTNTVKAHQLFHYAKAHGRQLEVKERLLRAYFVDGRHVGRPEDLADLAAEVGLDRDDALRSLIDDEYLGAVEADHRRATRFGIHAVPFFVIDGRHGVSGAQRSEVFAEALAKVAEERASAVA